MRKIFRRKKQKANTSNRSAAQTIDKQKPHRGSFHNNSVFVRGFILGYLLKLNAQILLVIFRHIVPKYSLIHKELPAFSELF